MLRTSGQDRRSAMAPHARRARRMRRARHAGSAPHAARAALLALALLCALGAVAPARALAAEGAQAEPTLTEAQAAIVVDQAGNVLFSKNADQEFPMASITKVMTAIVALDSGKSLDDACTITDANLGGDAQAAGYVETDTPTFRELLNAMLVYSANDAAYNVAVNVAGSEQAFVERMNAKAQEIGMTHTHFVNSHGLEDDAHYSSAEDLVKMARYAFENYPLISQMVHQTSTVVTVNGTTRRLYSTDELMGVYPGMRGIKTGKVSTGTTFLGASERNNVQLFTAVLGCTTNEGRFTDTRSLMDWAYQTYQQRLVARADWTLGLHPYAYDLGLKVVESPKLDETFSVWPDGGYLSYTTTRLYAGSLLEDGELTGASTWEQSGRTLGSVVLGASRLVRRSSWPLFSLPLFAETTYATS